LPQLSIIIVSYNCRELLAECVASIQAQASRITPEIVIVDNASADGVGAMVRTRFPEVLYLQNEDNLGFSRANNIGMQRATGKYFLLLNPDTTLPPGNVLDPLVDYMENHPGVGAAGGNLVDPHGNKQVSAGYAPSPMTLFAFSFFLAKITGNRVKGLSLLPVKGAGISEVRVDWLCAACMIVRREVLETVGAFNEDYFLYGEDIEWGCRISSGGWEVCHLPWAKVVHMERGTQQQERGVSCAWVDGMARVYGDLNPGRSRLFFKSCLGAGLALRALLYGVLSLFSRDPWPRQRTVEMSAWLRHLLSAQKG